MDQIPLRGAHGVEQACGVQGGERWVPQTASEGSTGYAERYSPLRLWVAWLLLLGLANLISCLRAAPFTQRGIPPLPLWVAWLLLLALANAISCLRAALFTQSGNPPLPSVGGMAIAAGARSDVQLAGSLTTCLKGSLDNRICCDALALESGGNASSFVQDDVVAARKIKIGNKKL